MSEQEQSVRITITMSIPMQTQLVQGRMPRSSLSLEVEDHHIASLSIEERQLLARAVRYSSQLRIHLKGVTTGEDWSQARKILLEWAQKQLDEQEQKTQKWLEEACTITVESILAGGSYHVNGGTVNRLQVSIPPGMCDDPRVITALKELEAKTAQAAVIHKRQQECTQQEQEEAKARRCAEEEAKERRQEELRQSLQRWASALPQLSRAVAEDYDVVQAALTEASNLVLSALPPLARCIQFEDDLYGYEWKELAGPSPAEFAQLDLVKAALKQVEDKLPEPDAFSVKVNRLRCVNTPDGSTYPAVWLDLCSPFWTYERCVILRCPA